MPRFSSAVATLFTRFENVVFCLCMRVAASRRCRSPTLPAEMPLTVFFAFRDSPVRRRALGSSRGSAERYALFGLDELAARGFRRPPQPGAEGGPPRWAVDRRSASQVGPRASRRLRRRLRDRARLVATGELGGRRLLDGGHGRDPADAPGASGSPPAAPRVRGDRAPGTPRPAALRNGCVACMRRRSAPVLPSSPTAGTRRTSSGAGWPGTASRPESCSFPSAWTPPPSSPERRSTFSSDHRCR